MTTAEAGTKEGSKTAATHGHEHYEEIGRRGGQKVVAERGLKFYSEIENKGGFSGLSNMRVLKKQWEKLV
jgi:uncharacterized protein